MGPVATGLDQQSHIELLAKISVLCESWWWTIRTHAKMNYLSDFCLAMLCIRAAYAVMRSVCVSVCVSVTFVKSVKTNKHIF